MNPLFAMLLSHFGGGGLLGRLGAMHAGTGAPAPMPPATAPHGFMGFMAQHAAPPALAGYSTPNDARPMMPPAMPPLPMMPQGGLLGPQRPMDAGGMTPMNVPQLTGGNLGMRPPMAPNFQFGGASTFSSPYGVRY